jgi:hypothetical protein
MLSHSVLEAYFVAGSNKCLGVLCMMLDGGKRVKIKDKNLTTNVCICI